MVKTKHWTLYFLYGLVLDENNLDQILFQSVHHVHGDGIALQDSASRRRRKRHLHVDRRKTVSGKQCRSGSASGSTMHPGANLIGQYC